MNLEEIAKQYEINNFFEYTIEKGWKPLKVFKGKNRNEAQSRIYLTNDISETNKDYIFAEESIESNTGTVSIYPGAFSIYNQEAYPLENISIDKNLSITDLITSLPSDVIPTEKNIIYTSIYKLFKFGIYAGKHIYTETWFKQYADDFKIGMTISFYSDNQILASKDVFLYENSEWNEDNCKLLNGDVILTFTPEECFDSTKEILICYHNGTIMDVCNNEFKNLFKIYENYTEKVEEGLYDPFGKKVEYGTIDMYSNLPDSADKNHPMIYYVQNLETDNPLRIVYENRINENVDIFLDNDKNKEFKFNEKNFSILNSEEDISDPDNTVLNIELSENKDLYYIDMNNDSSKHKYIALILDFGIYNRLINYCNDLSVGEYASQYNIKDEDYTNAAEYGGTVNTSILLWLQLDVTDKQTFVFKTRNKKLFLNVTVKKYNPTEDEELIDDEKKVLMQLAKDCISKYKEVLQDTDEVKFKYYLVGGRKVYMYMNVNNKIFYSFLEILKYTPYALTEDMIKETLNEELEEINTAIDLEDVDVNNLKEAQEKFYPDKEFELCTEEDFINRINNIYCKNYDKVCFMQNGNIIDLYGYIIHETDKIENKYSYTHTIIPSLWNCTYDRIVMLLRKYNIREIIIGMKFNKFTDKLIKQYIANSKQLYYKQINNDIMIYELTVDNANNINYYQDLNSLLRISPKDWDTTIKEIKNILNENGVIEIQDDII